MIDLRREKALTLSQAAALVPSRRGKTVSPKTVMYWCRVGYKGRTLRHVRRPSGDYLTSAEALSEFLSGVAAADRRQLPDTPDEALRKARLDLILRGRKPPSRPA